MSHRAEWPYPHAGCYRGACPGNALIVSPVIDDVVMVKGRAGCYRACPGEDVLIVSPVVSYVVMVKGRVTGLNGHILILAVTERVPVMLL